MLKVENVFKSYIVSKERYSVIENLNLSFPNHGFVLISGKSGSGKTTLLNLIGGIDSVDQGRILWNDQNISEYSFSLLSSYRNREVGFVFQDYSLFLHQTVLENLQLFEKQEEEILKYLKYLQLYDLRNKKVRELSSGEQQRVAILRAVLKNPPLFLLDEAISNLDQENAILVLQLLKQISRKSLVLFVSHDISMVRMYADYFYDMEQNQFQVLHELQDVDIDQNRKTSSLRLSSVFAFVKQFLFESKWKLFFSFLLFCVTMICFFFSFTLKNYDLPILHANALMEEQENYIILDKSTEFTEKELAEVEHISNSLMGLGYSFQTSDEVLRFPISYDLNGNYPLYYRNVLLNPSFLTNEFSLPFLIGRNPEKDYEIVISQYLADLFLYHGFVDGNDQVIHCQTYEELISIPNIKLGDFDVQIVGILKQDLSLYESFQKVYQNNDATHGLYSLFQGNIAVHAVSIFVSLHFLEYLKSNYSVMNHSVLFYTENKDTMVEILRKYPVQSSKITSITAFSNRIIEVTDQFSFLSKIFDILFLIFFVFAIIVFLHYFFNSFFKHYKDIGVMLCLGITRKDIGRIFFLEEVIFSMVAFFSSILLTVFGCFLVNKKVSELLLFSFSPFQLSLSSVVTLFVFLILLIYSVMLLFFLRLKKAKPSMILKQGN